MTPFPGFDGLRLAAALLVLMSHAMFTRAGAAPDDPVSQLLAQAGVHGVFVFFIISGFLLARSLDIERCALRFAVNRVLRIGPGFMVCVWVTALLFGAAGSALPLQAYFVDAELWRHLRLTLDCMCSNAWLPGVWNYAGDEAMRRVVNGSLWSLSAEVLSYLLLLALWLLLRSVPATVAALVALTLATRLFDSAYERLAAVAFTLPYFAGGTLAYLVVRRWGVHAGAAWACMAVVVLAAALGHATVAMAGFGAYALVWLGTRPNLLSRLSARSGDLSYGVYLYGWPVQQLVRVASPSDAPWVTLAWSLPLTLACAWLSQRFVEAPALRLKAPVTAGLRRLVDHADHADHAGRPGRAGQTSRAGPQVAGAVFATGALALLVWPQPHWWWVGSSLAGLALVSVLALCISNAAAMAWRAAR